jgi:archaeosine synthase
MQNLKNILKSYSKPKGKAREINGLKSIVRYQFNSKDADVLIPSGYRLKGRYNKHLFFENQLVATLQFDTGLFSLNLKGGQLLSEVDLNWVEIDFKLETNTLFAPGVIDSDSKILPRDEVVIVRKGDVVGVGKAVMSGEEMKKAKKGVAVRVRHRQKH